jgi:hypothetical protein
MVFLDLWQDFDSDDQAMMQALARGEAVDPNTPTFRNLHDQSFVEFTPAGAPVLAFPLFGRWIRDHRP